MKTVVRILNIVIMAFSLAASILMFTMPTFTFNSRINLNVKTFSKYVPETVYTADLDLAQLLGTDEIQVGIKFNLDFNGLTQTMGGDKDKINQYVINDNVLGIVSTLEEPIDIITDHMIRGIIALTIKNEIKDRIIDAKHKYEEDSGVVIPSTAEEIMEQVGMDDQYFVDFSTLLYNAANTEGATVNDITNVFYGQVEEALMRAEDSGVVDTSSFNEESMAELGTTLETIFGQLNLVNDDHSLKPISKVCYIYLAKYLKDLLNGKIDPAELDKKPGESEVDYSNRLLNHYVVTIMPDFFYKGVGYLSLAVFICVFLFAAIWGILFLITFFRTLSSKKPWTIFGPWFWIIGALQIVLGVGITFVGKYIVPKIPIPSEQIPINSVILAPRTFALIPSLIFIGTIFFAIAYAIVRSGAKREFKKELGGRR